MKYDFNVEYEFNKISKNEFLTKIGLKNLNEVYQNTFFFTPEYYSVGNVLGSFFQKRNQTFCCLTNNKVYQFEETCNFYEHGDYIILDSEKIPVDDSVKFSFKEIGISNINELEKFFVKNLEKHFTYEEIGDKLVNFLKKFEDYQFNPSFNARESYLSAEKIYLENKAYELVEKKELENINEEKNNWEYKRRSTKVSLESLELDKKNLIYLVTGRYYKQKKGLEDMDKYVQYQLKEVEKKYAKLESIRRNSILKNEYINQNFDNMYLENRFLFGKLTFEINKLALEQVKLYDSIEVVNKRIIPLNKEIKIINNLQNNQEVKNKIEALAVKNKMNLSSFLENTLPEIAEITLADSKKYLAFSLVKTDQVCVWDCNNGEEKFTKSFSGQAELKQFIKKFNYDEDYHLEKETSNPLIMEKNFDLNDKIELAMEMEM